MEEKGAHDRSKPGSSVGRVSNPELILYLPTSSEGALHPIYQTDFLNH